MVANGRPADFRQDPLKARSDRSQSPVFDRGVHFHWCKSVSHLAAAALALDIFCGFLVGMADPMTEVMQAARTTACAAGYLSRLRI
jgi:hypothetical protein